MYKRCKRIAACMLIIIVALSSANINIYAHEIDESENYNTESTDKDIIQENEDIEEAAETQSGTEDNLSDDSEGFQENAEKIEYVYVDETEVNIPETQSIVVGLLDKGIVISGAVLHYSSELTEKSYDMEASAIQDGTILFSEDYDENTKEDTYHINGITYLTDTGEENIDFNSEGFSNAYKVTNTVQSDDSNQEEVTVYAAGENDSLEKSGSSIENTVESALIEADPTAGDTPHTNSKMMRSRAANKTIVICAGHDSTHTGARGYGLLEEDRTFKVAQYCKAELEKYEGVNVYLDRDNVACKYPGSTTSYCLNQRPKDAAALGASTFVDIHFNAGGGIGSEVYYPNLSYNAGISADGHNLADKILNELSKLGLKNRGAKIRNTSQGTTDGAGNPEDYYTTNYLCKQLGMTGIIVEHAFLDNESDAAKVWDESFIQLLGVADATGIANAYGLQKKRPVSIAINKPNDFQGTFQVEVNTQFSGVSKVIISAWRTEASGDVKEYEAQNIGNGTYLINVDKKDFENKVGEYNVRAKIYYGDESKETNTVTYKLNDSHAQIKAQLSKDEKTYNVTANIINPPSGMTGISTAVWGTDQGQNDLKWYAAKQDAAGTWNADIAINGHGEIGKYYADTYAVMSNGTMMCLKTNVFEVTNPTMEVSVGEYDEATGTFEIIANNFDSPSGVKKIQFPVWYSENQEETIYWYDGVKQTDGSYKAVVNIKNHKYMAGTYSMHAYITTGNGIVKSFNAGTQEVTEVNVTVEDISQNETIYRMSAKNIGIFGAIGCQVAVWGDAGGQNDLRWYTAKQDAAGTWNADITISNHGEIGKYYADAYAVMPNGAMMCLKTNVFEVTNPTMKVSVGEYDEEAGTFEITASNFNSPSGVKKIQFPVWYSENQEETIYWYDGVEQADGSYKAVVNVKNHKYAAGTYSMHAYITTGNRIIKSFNAGTQEVIGVKSDVIIEDISRNETIYRMSAKNIGIYGAIGCQVAVWGDAGGQNDLRWYTAKQDAAGTWSADITIGNHGEIGKYYADAYAVMPNGAMMCLKTNVFEITNPTMEVNVGKFDKETGTFEITASNFNSPSGVKKIQFPVWYNQNQEITIHWYDGVKQADGSYKAVANVKNHKYMTGTYSMHAYMTTGNGIIKSFNAGTQEVIGVKPDVIIEDISRNETIYRMSAKNIGIYGAIGCQVAVWGDAGGQNDLRWYTAKQDAAGTWNADITIGNHREMGKYYADVYAVMPNGAMMCLKTNVFEVTNPTMEVRVGDYDEGTGTFEITASNFNSPSGVKKIQFPVWYSENQEETIHWYDGVEQADGSYKAVVNVKNHKYVAGTYSMHAYITTGNGIVKSFNVGTQEITNVIISDYYSIMGGATITVDQMVRYFKKNANYPAAALGVGGASTIEAFCQIAYEEASVEGVRAEVLFAQMMLETGYLKFGGDVQISQFNFGGLGATGGGVPGNSFPSVRLGIRAQVQHLKCYGCDQPLVNEKIDPRWGDWLRNKSPYVQWLGIQENPYGTGWASGKDYGANILNIISRIKSI